MKKFYLPLILVLMLSIFAGCDNSTVMTAQNFSANDSQALMAPPQNADTQPSADSASDLPAAASEKITAVQAEAAALAHAGYAAEQVTGMFSRFDIDDGRDEYDVEFFADGYEYDYEIDAVTGKVVSYDREIERTRETKASTAETKPSEPAVEKISKSEAESIALSHAGFKKSEVKGLRTEYGRDDGVYEYEVEFYANGYEYDYEINAKTGKIISRDKDRDD